MDLYDCFVSGMLVGKERLRTSLHVSQECLHTRMHAGFYQGV